MSQPLFQIGLVKPRSGYELGSSSSYLRWEISMFTTQPSSLHWQIYEQIKDFENQHDRTAKLFIFSYYLLNYLWSSLTICFLFTIVTSTSADMLSNPRGNISLREGKYNYVRGEVGKSEYQNQRDVSSRPINFYFYSFVYLTVCVFNFLCHASWPNQKRYRPEIWYTFSPRPYLKMGIFVFSKK